jgi:hypothetical protein
MEERTPYGTRGELKVDRVGKGTSKSGEGQKGTKGTSEEGEKPGKEGKESER